MVSLYHDSSPPSTVIEHVRDIFNDPAAGVRALCPSFHCFGLQGYFQAHNQGGRRVGEAPLKIVRPPRKMCWT